VREGKEGRKEEKEGIADPCSGMKVEMSVHSCGFWLYYIPSLWSKCGGEHTALCRNGRVLMAPWNAFKLS
jgi:hypothetical protein